MGVNRILVDFSGWTSAHGIPHVGSAQNNCLRVFWGVIFIASTGMFIFQMVLLVQKFTAYDVSVQTKLEFQSRVFPSVTMCNLNPFRREKQTLSPDMVEMMGLYQEAIHDPGASSDAKWGFKGVEDTIEIHSTAMEHLLFIAGNLTNTTRDKMTYQLKDPGDYASGFILNCAFNTSNCKFHPQLEPKVDWWKPDFKTIDDPLYGKCFTFNYHGQHVSSRAGPLYGLRLLALSNQQDYIPMTESAGIRVAVHDSGQEAFPDAFGYSAAAGFTTSFGVKYIETHRLPAPYGNCTDVREKAAYFYDGVYQVEGCFRSCVQKHVQDKCGCSDPRYKRGDNETQHNCFIHGKERLCANSFSSTSEDVENKFDIVNECSCPQPCTESVYGVTVSTALWPSDSYTPPECKYPKPHYPWVNNTEENACITWFKENTMLIEVYYERMNYQKLEESEAYQIGSLISDMGGQLGLWMGISAITVIEFASLGILLCMYCCNKSKHGNQDDDGEEEEVNAFDGKTFGEPARAPMPAQSTNPVQLWDN